MKLRAEKPHLTLNLRTRVLKLTSEPPSVIGHVGCMQGWITLQLPIETTTTPYVA